MGKVIINLYNASEKCLSRTLGTVPASKSNSTRESEARIRNLQ